MAWECRHGNGRRPRVYFSVLCLFYPDALVHRHGQIEARAGTGDDVSTETGKMKRLLIAFIVAPLIGLGAAGAVLASEAGYRLDTAPIDPRDSSSLQAGARTFTNYCLN